MRVSRRVSRSGNRTSVNQTGCHQPCRGSFYNLIEVARWLMSNVPTFRSHLSRPFTRAIKRTRVSKVSLCPLVIAYKKNKLCKTCAFNFNSYFLKYLYKMT
ncbi:hypothetical protein PUN28_001919 [Cardiocondyla obscurior]|uniref:Uncharacterized protein n=1 Tax=Cardiocondyla obscurior TaxID=286306 RepID=A0AAW2GRZ7_9HYME